MQFFVSSLRPHALSTRFRRQSWTRRPPASDAAPADTAAADPLVRATPIARLESFDAVRLLAALGIIWVHTFGQASGVAAWGPPARMGTAFFTLASVMFVLRSARNHPQRSFGAYAVERFRRLMLPCLLWSALTEMPAEITSVAQGRAAFLPPGEQLIIGHTYHLWFLPFAFVVSLLMYPLGRAVRGLPVLGESVVAWTCFLLGAGCALLPDQSFERLGQWHYIPEQSWGVLPSVFWGISVGLWAHHRPAWWRDPRLVYFGWAIVAATVGYYALCGFSTLSRNLGGLGLFFVASQPCHTAVWHALGRLGRLSFGVFLLHPFVLDQTLRLTGVRAAASVPQMLGVYALVAACTLAAAWALRQSRYTAWLVS